ncbi:MAG: hypothetical protein ABGZ53_21040 [Fuerstiella sp.]|jgi:hypothetical protein
MRYISTVLIVWFFAVTSQHSNGQQPALPSNPVGAPEPTQQSTVPGTQQTQSTDAAAPAQGNGAGYWLVRHASRNGGHFTGVAAVVETHYTGYLTNAGSVLAAGGDMRVGGLTGQMHIVNATIGLHGTLNQSTAIRIGYSVPLSDSSNRSFDGELILSLIRQI